MLFAAVFAVSAASPVFAKTVNIVAAENFYGDVAKQIGGTNVSVSSILSNPDQDPHLFEVSASVGEAVSGADIVVYSGIDYDPWMDDLLGAAKSAHRQSIVVAALAGRQDGDNPHAWYDVETMLAYAAVLTAKLSALDPVDAAQYQTNLAAFQASIHPIEVKIATMRQRLAGMQVTATEPIFGYMFAALGMKVRDQSFQLAVMNDTEPSASDIAGFETDLKTNTVKLLIYNSQATDTTADRMRAIAAASHVPVVGATETQPLGMDYQSWMMSELDAVDKALPQGSP